MAGDFDGKVALVTGAGSGIGRATALAFAREGAKVVVNDVDEAGGQATQRQIEDLGGEAAFLKADVSQAAEVQWLVEETVRLYGRLDCAHNNAGIEGPVPTPFTVDLSEEDFDRIIAINLKGVWLTMKHEIPQMLSQGGGAIVNTSSILGLVGMGGWSAYVASKHGVAGLTKVAALEYAKQGIRVNAVCPGAIDTPMVGRLVQTDPALSDALASFEPVGRLGRPQEIAEAVIWLCSDKASFVTGAIMPVDGAWIAQ